jgi:hypothetical protein
MHLPSTYTKANILRGMAVYAAGDAIAMVILGKFALLRMLGMMLLGGTVYAMEIPAYFAWISRKTSSVLGWRGQVLRAVLAWCYFNPLWIARHLAFAKVFSGAWSEISSALLLVALNSFLWSIPISFAGNFIIQNFVPERHRFLASAVFSGLNAIYYALSAVWFA